MIISKPHWISHAGNFEHHSQHPIHDHSIHTLHLSAEREKGVKPAIYSIHVHPDGKRIATGSLGGFYRLFLQLVLLTHSLA